MGSTQAPRALRLCSYIINRGDATGERWNSEITLRMLELFLLKIRRFLLIECLLGCGNLFDFNAADFSTDKKSSDLFGINSESSWLLLILYVICFSDKIQFTIQKQLEAHNDMHH